MGQVTIYLDDDTEKKMNDTVRTMSVSKSKWVASVIKEKLRSEWPESVRESVGSWSDFPTAESLRAGAVSDVTRESL